MTTPSLDPKMLATLVCPETQQPVTLGSAELVAQMNQASNAGSLKNQAGHMIHGVVEHVLVRRDGKSAYLVIDGVPNLLAEERIDL